MTILLLIWGYIVSHPEITSLGVTVIFELIVRRKPTDKDWSIINFIKNLIDAIVINKKKNRPGRYGDIH